MTEVERRAARDILRLDVAAFGVELVEGCIRVDRVPEHNKIDDQPERSELVFLTFTITPTRPHRHQALSSTGGMSRQL